MNCADFLASQHVSSVVWSVEEDALQIIPTLNMPKLPLQVARRQVAASPVSCLLLSRSCQAESNEECAEESFPSPNSPFISSTSPP